jgi:glycosyltransferase involved in cell wall biosynthesis
VVLAVGRLHPQKDYPTLVAAMAALQHRKPRPVLVVVGDGPDEDRVRHLVVVHDVDAQLLGRRDDVADLLHAADVLALSSVWEARALVVQEAMQVGLPVVATSVGGIPDLVGEDALLVPAGDAVAFAAALERVLDSPSEAAERARRGLLRAASWPDEAAVVDQVVDVYRDVLRRAQ